MALNNLKPSRYPIQIHCNKKGILEYYVKMGSPIEPGNLVSQGYSNFHKKKTAWMTIVHLPRFRIKH